MTLPKSWFDSAGFYCIIEPLLCGNYSWRPAPYRDGLPDTSIPFDFPSTHPPIDLSVVYNPTPTGVENIEGVFTMLKDLFSNRLFIGALAIFIFCVGGSLLYMQHVTQQGEKELAETQAHVAQWNERQKPTTAVADEVDTAGGVVQVGGDARKPSAGNPAESATTSGDDAAVPELSEAEIERLLAENRAQQAQRRADYIAEWGEPPPDGSYQHYRDNHGDVHRHYQGTVAISDYDFITKFAPTPEELERYKRLRVDLKAATSADEKNGGSWENPSPEVQRLDTELKSLRANAQREIPFPSGFGYYGANNSGFPSEAEDARLTGIAIREFYQRFGMEHLYELHEEPTKFYQKY